MWTPDPDLCQNTGWHANPSALNDVVPGAFINPFFFFSVFSFFFSFFSFRSLKQKLLYPCCTPMIWSRAPSCFGGVFEQGRGFSKALNPFFINPQMVSHKTHQKSIDLGFRPSILFLFFLICISVCVFLCLSALVGVLYFCGLFLMISSCPMSGCLQGYL